MKTGKQPREVSWFKDGKIVDTVESVEEAGRRHRVTYQAIAYRCKNGGTYGGLEFRYGREYSKPREKSTRPAKYILTDTAKNVTHRVRTIVGVTKLAACSRERVYQALAAGPDELIHRRWRVEKIKTEN